MNVVKVVIILPPVERGTKSPKPRVVMVVNVYQTEFGNVYMSSWAGVHVCEQGVWNLAISLISWRPAVGGPRAVGAG